MKYTYYILIVLSFALLLSNCKKNNDSDPDTPYVTTPYDLVIPNGFPDLYISDDNPLTVEGVQLGRMLFYDSLLDLNNSLRWLSLSGKLFYKARS